MRMTARWVLRSVVLAAALGSAKAEADERALIVAVFNLENDGTALSTKELERLTDLLMSEIAAGARYAVVPKSQLLEALRAQKKESYSACHAEACQIQIGQEVAASATLQAKVARFGQTCSLSLTLYDLKRAASAGAAVVEGGCRLEDVHGLVKRAVVQLNGAAAPAPKPALALAPAPRTAAPAASEAPLAERPKPASGSYEDLDARVAAAEQKEREAEAARAERAHQAEAAWSKVERFARTKALPAADRLAQLDRFLADFGADNPRRSDAEALQHAIRSEGQPWILSSRANLYFMRSEATVAQFRACLKAGVCQAGNFAVGDKCNLRAAGRDDHPMNCLSRAGAEQFCRFVGGRLPTAAEWLKEASDGGKHRFPWGDEPANCERAVMYDPAAGSDWNRVGGCGRGSTAPVCSLPQGNSASGLCDMAGNVWEWTSEPEGLTVGGSWSGAHPERAPSAYNSYPDQPTSLRAGTGVRCVSASPRTALP
jgi:formylglycine-generating enzyme required for sulfatase activity